MLLYPAAKNGEINILNLEELINAYFPLKEKLSLFIYELDGRNSQVKLPYLPILTSKNIYSAHGFKFKTDKYLVKK